MTPRDFYDAFWADVDIPTLLFAQSAFNDRASFDRFWDGVDLRDVHFARSGFNPRTTR